MEICRDRGLGLEWDWDGLYGPGMNDETIRVGDWTFGRREEEEPDLVNAFAEGFVAELGG